MLQIWTEQFLSNVVRLSPKFIALHCQEVGGKKYENSMKHVEDFVSLLTSSTELKPFDKMRVFLDEDYSSAENFTVRFFFLFNMLCGGFNFFWFTCRHQAIFILCTNLLKMFHCWTLRKPSLCHAKGKKFIPVILNLL